MIFDVAVYNNAFRQGLNGVIFQPKITRNTAGKMYHINGSWRNIHAQAAFAAKRHFCLLF